MEEYAKTELYLSEEQLQQITGGCGACEKDKRVRNFWDKEADISYWLAEGAAARRDPQTAAMHLKQAKANVALARRRQERIDARQGTPGHLPVPGEPSGLEPPAKRPRLQ
jgi:hypothetical protein